jgi:hypothetical protein
MSASHGLANFAGLLAWRVNLAQIAGPVRGLPATTPGFCGSQTFRRSDLRSLDSAVQSRVGDGFLACSRLESRVEQVQPDWVARLPEHEVRGDGEGHGARW